MNRLPPAVKETEPLSRFPFAERGVLKVHRAEPTALRPAPFSAAVPIAPAQASRVGLTGIPPLFTVTVTTITRPAFGLEGDTLAAPAVTAAGGATAGPVGVTAFVRTDSGPAPTQFRARIVNVYVTPF